MLMTIRIDQAVRLNADITPDQSSRVELEGGGDLSFQYTTQGEMILNGRYTLSGGMVKYAMPIIPLKEFTIQDGSYVQWSGNPMDPMLNLTATERMRASVTPRRRQLTSGHLQCRCGDQTDIGEPATAIYPLRTGRPIHATGTGQDGRRTTLADRRYDACHRDVPQHERCRRRRKETEPRYGSPP